MILGSWLVERTIREYAEEDFAAFAKLETEFVENAALADSVILKVIMVQVAAMETRLDLKLTQDPLERLRLEQRLQVTDFWTQTLNSALKSTTPEAWIEETLEELFPGRGSELMSQFKADAYDLARDVARDATREGSLDFGKLMERIERSDGGRVGKLLREEEARRRRRLRFWDAVLSTFYVCGSVLFIIGEWRKSGDTPRESR